jgi:2-methylcitrate dehydratase PrpD
MLLDAYIVGLEVQAWLGRRMIPAHYEAGWHATSTIGTIGAAGACARLLGLSSDCVRSTLSIATSMAAGSKAQFGTMVKPVHVGLAARNGITAARLAASGIIGIDDPFAGEWGFVKLHHGRDLHSQDPVDDTNGELAIISDGLAQKRFPCCASTHRTMDAVIELMEKHALNADEIERIETVVPDYDCQNLRYNQPTNEMEARFSMTYCVAVVALNGRMTLLDFTKTAVARPDVRSWFSKISMRVEEDSCLQTKGYWEDPAITTLVLKDSRCFQKEIYQPVGTIPFPLSDQELFDKYWSCVERSLESKQAETLYKLIMNMQNESARNLASYLRKK